MNGILIVDKPQGITSHDVVRRVRRLFRTRQVGHAGTLDPLATGVLPVAVGTGTRIVQFLMEGDKHYRATLKLGETTDTQDAEGTVLQQRAVPALSLADIEDACVSFAGRIRQRPPIFSALKKNGVPLHRLARQGIAVEIEEREITVHRLTVLEVNLPFVTLDIVCSKGTYVRTLCHDLGERLGAGAHMVQLRRIRNGSFSEGQSISLEDLESAGAGGAPLLSLAEALRGFPAVVVCDEAAGRLLNGVPPRLSDVSAPAIEEGAVVQLLYGERPLAMARYAPRRLEEKRGDFELLRVFLPAGSG